MAELTPDEINEILNEYFNETFQRTYIGKRYVPIFGRKGESTMEWDDDAPYEPLTIVLYEGNSYTSRQYVPIGIEITNTDFWANTGNYNAQVEQYRQEVEAYTQAYGDAISDLQDYTADTILTFDTVSDMKSSELLENGMVYKTIGYHSVNDGGGAAYIISSSGTANEMDIIACGTLYANLIIEPYMTPEMFGAYGDGTNDDTGYLERAMTVCAANGTFDPTDGTVGGTLHLMNKVYKITQVITIGSFGTFYSNKEACGFCLEGEGKSATVIECNGDGGIVFDGVFAELKNLCINNPSIGVQVEESSPYFNFENVYVKHASSYGFYFKDSTYMAKLEGCTANDCETGFKFIGYHTSLSIVNCYASDCTEVGFDFWVSTSGSAGATYSTMIGCGCDGGKIAYQLGPGCRGFSLISCGAERQTEKVINMVSIANVTIESFYATAITGNYIYITGDDGVLNVNGFSVHKAGLTNNNPLITTTGSRVSITIDKNTSGNRLINGNNLPFISNRIQKSSFTTVASVATLGTFKNIFSNTAYCAGKVKIWIVPAGADIMANSNQGYYELGIAQSGTYYAISEFNKVIKPDNDDINTPNFTFSIDTSTGELKATHAGTNIARAFQYMIETDGALDFVIGA